MNFKKWLYTEAFELPFINIQKIYEYYAESYKQYLKAPRTKIPPKLMPLDLSGSKYDFLQYLNPYVEIYVKGSLENAAGIYHGISQNHIISGVPNAKIGKIYLSFYNQEHVSYSTIEHEVLHFIQDLIKLHSKNSYNDKKNPALGGLPPMPIVKRLMKDREVDVHGNKKERRTKHEYRPIEFYTNLNSLIRSLQYYYIVLGIELGRGFIDNQKFLNFDVKNLEPTEKLLDWISNKSSKQTFLKKLIDRKDYIVSDLEKVKDLDEKLYKIYLREIYKNFIDNDKFASNASEVKKIIDIMKKSKDEKETSKRISQQKKEEKKEKLKEKVLMGRWTEADFTGRVSLDIADLATFSDIYDSNNVGYTNSEIAEEMFYTIGLKPNDNEKVIFGISAKNLKKIFDNIKKAKSTFGSTNIGKELDQEKINNNFDYMAKEMAITVSHQLNINTWSRESFKIPSPQEILDIFYIS
jgi:hypothetical protein